MSRFSMLSLLLCITLSVAAQNYVPFPTDSARWRVGYGMSIGGCTGFAGEAQYEITGDTVLGSQTYHKIYQISYSASTTCYATGGNGFAGGIREDSSKHVYIRYSASSAEELLYDFNLNVGDTVFTTQNCGCDATVIAIDSILIGTTYRKQFHVAKNFFCGGGTASIIEGIGSTKNLNQCFGWLEQTSSLTCFWQDGQALFPSASSNCTPLVQNIIESESVASINAFPNPATEQIVITSTNQFHIAQLVTIVDVNGRIVRSEVAQPENGALVIHQGDLGAGIYFIEITNHDGRVERVKVLFW